MSKENLEKFLDSIVGDNEEEANAAFHDYLKDKFQVAVHGEVSANDVSDENFEVSSDEKKEDSSE